ncbi:type 1 glutamine amidotransferase [bacterium]|nr:type 1 glutamine amidotransferase [bacterium]
MRLKDKKVAFLVGPKFEDLEFWAVYMRLIEEGAKVTVASPEAGKTYTSKNGGLTATSEVGASSLRAEEFDAVVVPGGYCPDKIRRDEGVKKLVREAYEKGRIVGMICHAGSVGLSAGIVHGKRATGSEGIKDDLLAAGATWVDEPAFREGNIVWGRVVEDIPFFNRELVSAIERGGSG